MLSLAAVILLAGQTATSVPRGQTSPIQLKLVKNLNCTFTASAAGAWQNGEPQARIQPAGEKLTLIVSKIDLDDESATIDSRGSQTAANATLSGSNLYFLDLRPDGAAFLTTVFAQESRDKRLKATYTQTDPTVAVYYGDCQVVDGRQ